MVPVLGEGNIYGFPGCLLCSSTSRSTACFGIAIVRMEFCVFGLLTTSSPLMRLTCFVMEIVILDLNSVEMGHVLAALVEQELLLVSKKGRWTSYRLNTEFSIPEEQLHLDSTQDVVRFSNEADRIIYEYIFANGFIASHQILDITKITTTQGANAALGRLMNADLVEKV